MSANFIFLTGLISSIIVVLGAAWPEAKKGQHPVTSIKNWLFVIGALGLFLYALLGYLAGGSLFFVLLEGLVIVASILTMANTNDRLDTIILSSLAAIFALWSLALFEGYGTLFFVAGLFGIGLGYVFDPSTLRRELSLVLGSALIALFSYLEGEWIFFWLNVFFALFSSYYLWKVLREYRISNTE